MKQFFRYRVFEWIFCTLITAALAEHVISGFILTDGFSGNPAMVILLSAVVEFVMLMFSVNRKTLVLGIIAGIAALAAVISFAWNTNPFEDESANSLFLFFFIVIVMGVIIFPLTRTGRGCIALAFIGMLVVCTTWFLQFPAPVWSYFVFFTAAALQLLYRRYMEALKRVALGSVRHLRYVLQSVIVLLIAGAIAAGAYYGIVRPLDPPTQELKLLENLRTMDLLKVLGVSDLRYILDPDQKTDNTPDDTEYDRDKTEAEEETPTPTPEASETPYDMSQNEEEDSSSDSSAADYLEIRESIFLPLLLLLTLIVMWIVMYPEAHRYSWHENVKRLSREDAVVNYYHFFMKRYRVVGIGKDKTRTLKEFNKDSDFQLSAYYTDTTEFKDLTVIYEKVVYGHQTVTAEEYEKFEDYYREFYENLRMEMGFFKFYFRFFFL